MGYLTLAAKNKDTARWGAQQLGYGQILPLRGASAAASASLLRFTMSSGEGGTTTGGGGGARVVGAGVGMENDTGSSMLEPRRPAYRHSSFRISIWRDRWPAFLTGCAKGGNSRFGGLPEGGDESLRLRILAWKRLRRSIGMARSSVGNGASLSADGDVRATAGGDAGATRRLRRCREVAAVEVGRGLYSPASVSLAM
jgi:hypothetical protein